MVKLLFDTISDTKSEPTKKKFIYNKKILNYSIIEQRSNFVK